jgi:hypothetical protein
VAIRTNVFGSEVAPFPFRGLPSLRLRVIRFARSRRTLTFSRYLSNWGSNRSKQQLKEQSIDRRRGFPSWPPATRMFTGEARKSRSRPSATNMLNPPGGNNENPLTIRLVGLAISFALPCIALKHCS